MTAMFAYLQGVSTLAEKQNPEVLMGKRLFGYDDTSVTAYFCVADDFPAIKAKGIWECDPSRG